MKPDSGAFCALKAAASSEFTAAIGFALNPEECPSGDVSQEALARWFPRTYPHDLPRLRQLCRLFPDESSAQQEILDSLEQDGELNLDIVERIRRQDVLLHAALSHHMQKNAGKTKPIDGKAESVHSGRPGCDIPEFRDVLRAEENGIFLPQET